MSNGIAAEILTQGLSNPGPVLILIENRITAIAAILGSVSCLKTLLFVGILKSGNYYVPLESFTSTPFGSSGSTLPIKSPSSLLKHKNIILNCKPNLLLTDTDGSQITEEAAKEFPSLRIISTEKILPKQNPPEKSSAHANKSLAYIYYTSGTTGDAKGVMDTHRSVLHNVYRYTHSLQITSRDKLSLIQSLTFSGTVSTMFSALLNGGTLYSYNLYLHGTSNLGKWCNDHGLTMWHSVPSLFRIIANSGNF